MLPAAHADNALLPQSVEAAAKAAAAAKTRQQVAGAGGGDGAGAGAGAGGAVDYDGGEGATLEQRCVK